MSRWVAQCRITAMLLVALALALAAPVARADEVVDEAARIILRHALMHPDPALLDRTTRAALLASLQRIDPAAQWWPPAVAAGNRDWTGKQVVGYGVSVIDDGHRILFVPLPGGALARAGISRPVRLLTLAGQPAGALSLEAVEGMLADPAHDTAVVSLQDLDGSHPVHLVLKRALYDAVPVERIDAHGVPVLRIHRFVKGLTLRQVRQAVQPILAAGQPLILDLRYCAGGDLFEALDTASLFLPPGLPLAVLVDATGRRTVLKSVNNRIVSTASIGILIGSGTVSAAEIFAAALRDQAKARLIGAPTFGKCLAQSTFPLIDGSVLVLSTERILTAAGWYCDGHGLTPDVPAPADDTEALLARLER
jgi:carboxyl-terminal processing protease